MMKYIEKLKEEYPECVSEDFTGGCEGCPEDYGYEPRRCKCPEGLEYQDIDKACRRCWAREAEE